MINRTRSNLLRSSAATAAICLSLQALPALAQQQTSEAAAAAGQASPSPEADTIVVTGSRIQSPTISSVSPVQVVSTEQISQAGITNIQDLLNENPAFSTPGLSRTNSAFLTSGTGAATINLRNLGFNRSLVLINGRRVVAGIPGTSAVDVNVIPTQFLQRVDVLTGGASSLYGSDAVAGVVNFIYKENFEGIEAMGQYGLTQRGDTPEYQANLTVGHNFSEDRGNFMLHFGYTKQGQLLSRERNNTRVDDSDTFALTGDPNDFGIPTEPFFSGFNLPGVFTAGGCPFTYGPTGALQRGASSNGGVIPAGQAAACGVAPGTRLPATGFNRQNFRTLATPVQRYLFAARTRYDIEDNLRFIAEGTYNRTSSAREIEPFALASGGAGGIYPADGAVPIETRVRTLTPNPLGAGFPAIESFPLIVNPLIPAAIVAAATDTNGDGLRDFAFSRRLGEFGSRSSSTNRDFYRFVVGLEGDILSDKFHWDASYNYGRVSETQTGTGQVNVLNFRNALAAIPGPTGPICADASARAEGCVPINIFGAGSISPAAVRYVGAEQTLNSVIQQQVLTANVNGTLIDLPAGPLGIALGVEYRREKSSENNDALTNAGLNGGNALPDTRGKFDVKEIYGEINVPLLADTPFFHALTVRAAGRISDYSTVGTVYSYNGGLEWAPIEDIRFTGTYSRSVRAPNIGELFQGPAQTFPPGIVDPCEGVTATRADTLGQICRSFAGVNANIAANGGAFTLRQEDRQGISGFNLGNPNLFEEKSDSYTIGAVINPRSINALRNLVLRVDYYNINVKDAIVGIDRNFILDQCFNQGNQDLCSFVRRRPLATAVNNAGTIEFVDQAQINGGRFKTAGLDFTLNYRQELDDLVGVPGALNFRGTFTRLLTGYVVPVPGAPKDQFKGEIGTPKNRFTSTIAYVGDRVGINFTGTYLGKSSIDDQFLAGYDLAPRTLGVNRQFYLDTQVQFKAADTYEFYFGIDNLTDTKAPNILTNVVGNVTGSDTAADVYDIFGRRFYAGVRLRL